MRADSDFERIAQTWLEDGATVSPDRAVEAALGRIHLTRQQRFGAVRRSVPTITGSGWFAIATIAVLLLTASGVLFLWQANQFAGPAATPSPTPNPTTSPTFLAIPQPGASIPPGKYWVLDTGPSSANVITFTADAGWHVLANTPTAVGISRDAEGSGSNSIRVSFELPHVVYADACNPVASPPIVPSGSSVPAFITALRQLDGGWKLSDRGAPLTVGTMGVLVNAVEFDLSWAQPNSGPRCAPAGVPLRAWDTAVLDGRLPQRLILFDLDGQRVLIDYALSSQTLDLEPYVERLISSVSFSSK